MSRWTELKKRSTSRRSKNPDMQGNYSKSERVIRQLQKRQSCSLMPRTTSTLAPTLQPLASKSESATPSMPLTSFIQDCENSGKMIESIGEKQQRQQRIGGQREDKVARKLDAQFMRREEIMQSIEARDGNIAQDLYHWHRLACRCIVCASGIMQHGRELMAKSAGSKAGWYVDCQLRGGEKEEDGNDDYDDEEEEERLRKIKRSTTPSPSSSTHSASGDDEAATVETRRRS
jgi:hypothetical protein